MYGDTECGFYCSSEINASETVSVKPKVSSLVLFSFASQCLTHPRVCVCVCVCSRTCVNALSLLCACVPVVNEQAYAFTRRSYFSHFLLETNLTRRPKRKAATPHLGLPPSLGQCPDPVNRPSVTAVSHHPSSNWRPPATPAPHWPHTGRARCLL